MLKHITLCLFLLICTTLGQNIPLTLNNPAAGSVVPCQYLVYQLNITNAVVSNYLNLDFDVSNTNYDISVEVSDLPYATWGQNSNASYVGAGSQFSIEILCDYTTVSTWYIAVTAVQPFFFPLLPVNFTVLATQQTLVVTELTVGAPFSASQNGRSNAFGVLTDFYHVKLNNTISPGQIVRLDISSSASISNVYANTNTLAAFEFDQNTCSILGTAFSGGVFTIDYCTLQTILGQDLYFTVVPSQNISYTVTLSIPAPSIGPVNPTGTPWNSTYTPGTLTSSTVNYYSFSIASNTTAQVLNITINNVQGGTVSFSYSTGQLPFVSCESGGSCITNSINCCTNVATSCQLVVQPCNIQLSTVYYIGVQANTFNSFNTIPITYEILVSTTGFGTVTELSNDVFASGSLAQAHYDQYIFDNNGFKINDETTLSIHLYVDQSNSAIPNFNTTLFLNFDDIAGASDSASCWSNYASCTVTNVGSCTIQLNPCILNDYEDWYASVYTGYTNNFYGREVSYTIVAQLAEPVELSDPYLVINSVLYYESYDHYQVSSSLLPSNGGFSLVVFNVLGGSLNVYLNFGGLAGPLNACPSCFNNTEVRVASQSPSPLVFSVTNCNDFVNSNTKEVFFSIENADSSAVTAISYSVTVEEIKNYKPNDDLQSGIPLVANIGPHSSLNYTIDSSTSDSYLLVSLTQIDFIETPLTLTLYNATSLSCINSESLINSTQIIDINQYASIIVPECQYAFGDGYIVVVDNPSDNTINYNVYYETPTSTPQDLANYESYSDVVPSNGREFFTYSPIGQDTIIVEVYFDACFDIYNQPCKGVLNVTTVDPDSETGCIPPEQIEFTTTSTKSCVFSQTTCNQTKNDFFMIISTESILYPEHPLGYTITVSEFNSSVPTAPNRPINMNIYPKQKIYHTFNYPQSNAYPTINILLSNIQNGSASLVVSQSAPPSVENQCPCYDYSSQLAHQYIAEYCNAVPGEWSALIQASGASNQLVGYTITVEQLDNVLSSLLLNTPFSGSLSKGQYAFFNITGLDLSSPTVVNVASTSGTVSVYTTSGSQPATIQCGQNSRICYSTSQCSVQLTSCNTAGTTKYLSVYGLQPTSYSKIGFTISISQVPPVVLASNIVSPLQQLQPNFFYEYIYQLPVTFNAPFVLFALGSVSTSASYSVAVYDNESCFNAPLAQQTCSRNSPTCNVQVSVCNIPQNATLYAVVTATNALNYTITASFVDLTNNLVSNLALNTTYTQIVSAGSYVTFAASITNPAQKYTLTYAITTNVTNRFDAYANWNTVTPQCNIWTSNFVFSVTNSLASCCVQSGTFSVLVYAPVGASISIIFQQVPTLSQTLSNPSTNAATYTLVPQQTQEFSIAFNNVNYFDFLFVTVQTDSDATIYFQQAGLAGSSSSQKACTAYNYRCVGDQVCTYQVPQCTLSTGLVSPFVPGNIFVGVQNIQNQNDDLGIILNYGTANYTTIAGASPVTVPPLTSAYGIFAVTGNSVDKSVIISVASNATSFTYNIYSGDCPTTQTRITNQLCSSSPCTYTASTCGGVTNYLIEIVNPTTTPFSGSFTVSYGSPFTASSLGGNPVSSINVSGNVYYDVSITSGTGSDYAQLVITDFTGDQNDIEIYWAIAGINVCFVEFTELVFTDNNDGTYDITAILNSCLLATGTYYFQVYTPISTNYTIAFDPLQPANPTEIVVPASVAGTTKVNERVLYNLTIAPGVIKPGQSLEITFQNQCGSSLLYINQGSIAGPECGDTEPIGNITINSCLLLYLPFVAAGDSALFLTVVGESQSNPQYDMPAQYLLTVDVVGDPIQFVTVGLDEIVPNTNGGNNVYVFSISGVNSFVGQIGIIINEFSNGGATILNVAYTNAIFCDVDFTLSNTGSKPSVLHYIDSCEANSNREIYLQFQGSNENSQFQITHTRPFIRNLDEFDEQPQEGAVTPSVNSATSFIDEEYFSISLNNPDIENFLFTAWVTGDDDDESLLAEQQGIRLTTSQIAPPSLCSSGSDYESAPFNQKVSWEWCQVDMENQLYLTVNYPSQTPGNSSYPYFLYYSFGLDDEDITELPVNSVNCSIVSAGETVYFEYPLPADDQNVYSVEIYAINSDFDSCESTLSVNVAYGGLASNNCNLGKEHTQYNTQNCAGPCNNAAATTCLFELNCPFDILPGNTNLSVSVTSHASSDVSFYITMTSTPINSVPLTLDAAPILIGGLPTAYYFTLTIPTLAANSYVTLSVDPVGTSTTSLWYAFDYIPSSSCNDGGCSGNSGCESVIDSCNSLGSNLILAVTSSVQFYLSATTSTVPTTSLPLNTYLESSFATTASLNSVVTYNITVTDTDIANSLFGQLAVTIYGLNQGTIDAWISYGTIGNANCYINKAILTTSPSNTLDPHVLLIDYCSFAAGNYYVSLLLHSRSDSCSSVNYGLIATIGTSNATQTSLTAGAAVTKPISIGTTTTDYYAFNAASGTTIISLEVDIPETISYTIDFWTSPYGTTVQNENNSCITDSIDAVGPFIKYWFGCSLDTSFTFSITITTPSDLSVLPGVSYSVTANTFAYTPLSNSSLSATFSQNLPLYAQNFYSFTFDGESAFEIDVDVTQGPAVLVNVYGGLCAGNVPDPLTTLVCAYGPCSISLDWSTGNFLNGTTYYVTVEGFAPSQYNIALLAGEAETCIPAQNTTLCDVTWNVWNYGTGTTGFVQQNNAAIAFYNDLVNRFCPPCECAELSSACNDSLIEFTCTQNYRACDTTGLQASICQDSCEDIEENCGYTFEEVGLPQFSCNHNFYYTDSDGSDVCEDIYEINQTSGDKLLWLIVLIVIALILIVLIAVGIFIGYKKYQQGKHSSYEAIQDGDASSSSSSSINSTE